MLRPAPRPPRSTWRHSALRSGAPSNGDFSPSASGSAASSASRHAGFR